jgi:hypothetical protein
MLKNVSSFPTTRIGSHGTPVVPSFHYAENMIKQYKVTPPTPASGTHTYTHTHHTHTHTFEQIHKFVDLYLTAALCGWGAARVSLASLVGFCVVFFVV